MIFLKNFFLKVLFITLGISFVASSEIAINLCAVWFEVVEQTEAKGLTMDLWKAETVKWFKDVYEFCSKNRHMTKEEVKQLSDDYNNHVSNENFGEKSDKHMDKIYKEFVKDIKVIDLCNIWMKQVELNAELKLTEEYWTKEEELWLKQCKTVCVGSLVDNKDLKDDTDREIKIQLKRYKTIKKMGNNFGKEKREREIFERKYFGKKEDLKSLSGFFNGLSKSLAINEN